MLLLLVPEILVSCSTPSQRGLSRGSKRPGPHRLQDQTQRSQELPRPPPGAKPVGEFRKEPWQAKERTAYQKPRWLLPKGMLGTDVFCS